MTRLTTEQRTRLAADNAALGRALLPAAPQATAPTARAARPLNNPGLASEGVRDPGDRRRVVYWRYRIPGRPGWVGAVKRTADGQWEATGWPLDGQQPAPKANTALGAWPARAQAESVLLRHARSAR